MSRREQLMGRPFDRYAIGLGLGATAMLFLGIADRTPLRLIAVGPGAVLVTLVGAAMAVAGGLLATRALVLAAGAGFLAAAVLQVVQMSLGESNWLGGDGSTVGVFLGYGAGLLAIGAAQSMTPKPEDRDESQ